MFMPSSETLICPPEDEFTKPVESIMRCEDFKSNFARRLSNRYISRSPVTSNHNKCLKLRSSIELAKNVPERIEPYSQLSESKTEHSSKAVKPPEKLDVKASEMRCTEVSALNLEVETLRWQLAQTDASRQMHIALLGQIVTFLKRVKEHIEYPNLATNKKENSHSSPSKLFNITDLPRTRSVVHVNKNVDYLLSPTKNINPRKISKSISNVSGFKDYNGVWNQSKLSLITKSDTTQKMTEEISRLITLANTVLSTKLPDLALGLLDSKQNRDRITQSNSILDHGVDHSNTFILNNICNTNDGTYSGITNTLFETNEMVDSDIISPSPLTGQLDLTTNQLELSDTESFTLSGKVPKNIDKRIDYQASNFTEDESGFSSMSSFQEIGIPIISIIPPSPCREMGYLEEITDMLEDADKWKTDTIDLDKQTVKVFWV